MLDSGGAALPSLGEQDGESHQSAADAAGDRADEVPASAEAVLRTLLLGIPPPLRAVVVTGTVAASASTARRRSSFDRAMNTPPEHRSKFRTIFDMSMRVEATVEDLGGGVNESRCADAPAGRLAPASGTPVGPRA